MRITNHSPGTIAKIGAAAAAVAVSTAFFNSASYAASPRGSGAAEAASASLTAGHPYRHGVVPSAQWARAHAASAASSTNLVYNGGVGGVGVTIGHPRIYLVFWGSQWGTAALNGNGYTTFSGDSKGVAPDLEAFFKGLGTQGETWSGVMTQYCDGVAVGAQTCPAGAVHTGYPTGGAYAGLWEDASSPSPAQSTPQQIAQEAVRAAEHFGNVSTASNASVQYDVISPTGTNPDDYNLGGGSVAFCAWHDYTGDPWLGGVTTPWGAPIAFTNMPYVPDVGLECGSGWVNPGNPLDGVTIVNGHEYAETLTDQFPAGGWLDNSNPREETGDKCAWLTTGPGRTQDIKLSTGTFPVQGTWANDDNGGTGGCEVSHPIVGSGPSWAIKTSPNPSGTLGSYLTSVNCASSTRCVAVGGKLEELWNGSQWQILQQATPPGARDWRLFGVACPSTTLCVAVGEYTNSSGQQVTLAQHWNGSTWANDHTVNQSGAHYGILTRVACPSTTSCFAVGYYNNSANVDVTLVEHWNGSSWAIMTSPNPAGARSSQLLGVKCPSSSACTAVGTSTNGSGVGVTLAEHWDGRPWALLQTPNPTGSTGSYLTGLGCPTPTSCMAVGYYLSATGAAVAMAEWWNGTNWTIRQSSNPAGNRAVVLSAVTCPAPTTCIAVGDQVSSSGSEVTLAELWNGSQWAVQPTPSPSGSAAASLAGVACTSTINCTAVGSAAPLRGFDVTLAESYS